MPPDPTFAWASWYAAGYAVLVALDVAVWGYALHLLDRSRAKNVIRALSWAWVTLPVVVIAVASAHAAQLRETHLQAIFSGPNTAPKQAVGALLDAPRLVVPDWTLYWGPTYLEWGYVIFALLTIVLLRKQPDRPAWWSWMAWPPVLTVVYDNVWELFR